MAGQPSTPTPVAPAGSPPWAIGMLRGIVEWVERKATGPLRLTGYTNIPAVGNYLYSLIWDTTNVLPKISDGTAWLWVPAYSSGTATAVANAGTINARAGKLTTEALVTAAGAGQVLTITNSKVAATDHVFCSVANGTNTQGLAYIGNTVPGAGSFTVDLRNCTASGSAFNGTLVISFWVIKA